MDIHKRLRVDRVAVTCELHEVREFLDKTLFIHLEGILLDLLVSEVDIVQLCALQLPEDNELVWLFHNLVFTDDSNAFLRFLWSIILLFEFRLRKVGSDVAGGVTRVR